MRKRLTKAEFFEDTNFLLLCRKWNDHQDCPIHSHDFYELVVILDGHGRHVTGAGEYSIKAGDVFLIRGNMVHGYADTDRMTLANILFDPHQLGLPMRMLRDLPGYHALFRVEPRLRSYDGFRNHLHLDTEELSTAERMIARLERELEDKRPGYRFMACSYLMEMIVFFSRAYGKPDRQNSLTFRRMGEVLSYIEQNYSEEITIDRLTKIAGMSESTLLRTFKRVLNRSPMEQVMRTRILKAAELLERDDILITEVAFDCGFNDSNYFTRQFNRAMGVTPTVYREKNRSRKNV
ncbi:MAG: helix-turn-helix domain-containing protein [Lentisphaerae bacterium]|jgi:AraC-like DNA-binding protein|nr:helix-turn-helix domain-containing protein [Lentisphaerota bacterium]